MPHILLPSVVHFGLISVMAKMSLRIALKVRY